MASSSSPRPSCEKVGSSARNAVTWVSANTKTRSKNSSSGETLASRGSARIRRPRGRSSSRVALISPIACQSRKIAISSTGARSGTRCSWRGSPRCSRPIGSSSSGQARRRAAGRRGQDGDRAPVAGQPARVRAEQHDVGGDRGRQHVLVVLVGVAGLLGAGHDQRGRAVELGARAGLVLLGGGLELRLGVLAEHAEAPRVGDVVVRRPAGELEQLEQDGGRDGVGTERLVRAAGADELVDHPGDARRRTASSAFASPWFWTPWPAPSTTISSPCGRALGGLLRPFHRGREVLVAGEQDGRDVGQRRRALRGRHVDRRPVQALERDPVAGRGLAVVRVEVLLAELGRGVLERLLAALAAAPRRRPTARARRRTACWRAGPG